MSKKERVILGEISNIITGPFGSQLHQSDYVPVGVACIMPQNIGNRTLNKNGIARITKNDAERLSRYIVKENDIVYARRGDVEKHAFISDKDAGSLCGTGCVRVRVIHPKAYPLYISFYLNRPESKRWISQHAVGSNMPNLNTEILKSVPLELPSIAEQKAVSHFLANIDRKIQLNNRICSELEAMAKTLYDYWFVQFDFPDENGRPYRTSGGEMVWNEQLKREIPKGWRCASLSDFISIENSSVNPTTFGTEIMEHYSIPAYDDNFYPAFEQADAIQSGKYRVRKDSILVSKLNPQFKRVWDPFCISENAICSTEFMVYIPHKDYLRPFCFALVNSDGFYHYMVSKAISSTGSRKRIQPDVSVTYRFATPDTDALLSTFSTRYCPIMDKIKQVRLENYELQKLRDWLLPMLMNGQARVE